jgi:hypothetical protein
MTMFEIRPLAGVRRRVKSDFTAFNSFSYAGVNRIRFEGTVLCRSKELSQTHIRSPLRKARIRIRMSQACQLRYALL